MSGPKGFIQRWSRRKRAAAQSAQPTLPSAAPDAAAEVPAEARATGTLEDTSAIPSEVISKPAFDIAKLPAIESITAETDIRAFLAPGIPPELTRAALRRAWAADPKIRDFVGLSENSWNFNAPGAIAGFGPLEMTDELRRRIAQFVGRNIASEAADASSSTEGREARVAIETSGESNAGDGNVPTPQPPTSNAEALKSGVELPRQLPRCAEAHIATQCEPELRHRVEATAKGLHGRALPK